MPGTSCQYERSFMSDCPLGEEAKAVYTGMLRCSAQRACRRSIVCSDRAIDLLRTFLTKMATI
jgi:hypothetical protein